MQALSILGGLVGLTGLVAKSTKPPAAIQPLPTATRDDAASEAAKSDLLARRQGSAADILNGTRGAEALTGTTGKLVLGN